jgi:hypothetical protein
MGSRSPATGARGQADRPGEPANAKPTATVSKVTPRMRYFPRALRAGWLGLAGLFIAACGGGAGLLAGGQASQLNSQLDQVSSALTAGQCGAPLQSATRGLITAVANLPSTINTNLRQDLSQGVSTVSELAVRQCKPVTTTTATTAPTTTATTTATTSTSTTPTHTATTITTPTTPATTPSTTGTTTGSSGGGALSGEAGGGGQGLANNGNGNSNG